MPPLRSLVRDIWSPGSSQKPHRPGINETMRYRCINSSVAKKQLLPWERNGTCPNRFPRPVLWQRCRVPGSLPGWTPGDFTRCADKALRLLLVQPGCARFERLKRDVSLPGDVRYVDEKRRSPNASLTTAVPTEG